MYVRRNSTALTPPANYAGTAFSNSETQTSFSDKDMKIHKPNEKEESKGWQPSVLTSQSENPEKEVIKTDEDLTDESQEKRPKDTLSGVLDEKYSLEDLLLLGSILLLLFGNTDDEILLLAGVLLILGNQL